MSCGVASVNVNLPGMQPTGSSITSIGASIGASTRASHTSARASRGSSGIASNVSGGSGPKSPVREPQLATAVNAVKTIAPWRRCRKRPDEATAQRWLDLGRSSTSSCAGSSESRSRPKGRLRPRLTALCTAIDPWRRHYVASSGFGPSRPPLPAENAVRSRRPPTPRQPVGGRPTRAQPRRAGTRARAAPRGQFPRDRAACRQGYVIACDGWVTALSHRGRRCLLRSGASRS